MSHPLPKRTFRILCELLFSFIMFYYKTISYLNPSPIPKLKSPKHDFILQYLDLSFIESKPISKHCKRIHNM